MDSRVTPQHMRMLAETKRREDPVFWGEWLRTVDRQFVRPADNKYNEWLAVNRFAQICLSERDWLDEEWAWQLTDSYVSQTRTGRTECYPVLFCAFAPSCRATPELPEDIRKGYLLLGFVTIVAVGTHPESTVGEPQLAVDEAFVLPCWHRDEVEPMLRGCFLYA
jgi:hypothetical protein